MALASAGAAGGPAPRAADRDRRSAAVDPMPPGPVADVPRGTSALWVGYPKWPAARSAARAPSASVMAITASQRGCRSNASATLGNASAMLGRSFPRIENRLPPRSMRAQYGGTARRDIYRPLPVIHREVITAPPRSCRSLSAAICAAFGRLISNPPSGT